MIITCPDCTTRYDVDDERFSPNGRSVRCSSCGESWFVPAPELIDVAPMKREEPARSHNARRDEEHDRQERAPMKVGFADVRRDDRDADRHSDRGDGRQSYKRGRADVRDDDNFQRDHDDRDSRNARGHKKHNRDESPRRHEDDDDSLFDTPRGKNQSKDRDRDVESRDHKSRADKDRNRDDRDSRNAARDYDNDGDDKDDNVSKGWRKGRQFIVEDDDADDVERRPFFARKRKDKESENDRDSRDSREALRFADDDASDGRSYNDDSDYRDDDYHRDDDDIDVVDADFEDVDDDGDHPRGFGRRVREKRRRATALARMEDVRPFDPESLDEEFFASLRVTPRELEKAIRKARRRAESREKNRLTPLRVFGWTAWIAAVAGVCYAVVIYRDDIVKLAPKAADAYAVIGIEANPYGLAIENVRHRLAMSTGGPTIEITGNLRNETNQPVAAPLLQAEALGPRGELLARWTFTANETMVDDGGAVEFVTRSSAPEGVAEVALSFAPAKSVLDSLVPDSK